ncbi:MAG: serine hydrolase, partial [Anaerolineae bacterium]|nr:serine hydrolase [Anaerolineae bacterium]
MSTKRVWLIVLCLMLALPSLALLSPVRAQDEATYWPTDGWRTSTPEEQGMDSEALAAFIAQWGGAMDSLIIIRHGYIVAEMYSAPNTAGTLHDEASITKAVTGSLLGIAMDEGLVPGMDTPVLSLFPDRTFENVDADKEAMTLRHLSTMTSGLDCASPGVQDGMEASDDWLQYALDAPMAAQPGGSFAYCNMNTHVLAAILAQATGQTPLEYANDRLFGPLGITDVQWLSDPTGLNHGYADIYMTPRDLAKFGYLYLHGGEWDGEQLVPADYAQAAVATQAVTGWPDLNYGYNGWWRFESANLAWSLGWGGQSIYYLVDKDLLVVFNEGGLSENLRLVTQGYPISYAIAGLSTADEALPANPDGEKALEAAMSAFSNPPAKPVPELPALAAQISGQTYGLMTPNLLTAGIERLAHVRTDAGRLDSSAVNLRFDGGDEATLTVTYADGAPWAVPVGLDGLYRVSESRIGPVGVRGMWLADDSFRVEIKYIGTSNVVQLDVT